MKLTYRRSMTTVKMSPLPSAPPRSGSVKCTTVPPAKWTPALISVRPGSTSWTSPLQNSTLPGRHTHSRSASWMYTGASQVAQIGRSVVTVTAADVGCQQGGHTGPLRQYGHLAGVRASPQCRSDDSADDLAHGVGRRRRAVPAGEQQVGAAEQREHEG